jgi:hypothetical protein
MTRVREPVRFREAQENMQRIRFVLLVLVAAMLGALIFMGDSIALAGTTRVLVTAWR